MVQLPLANDLTSSIDQWATFGRRLRAIGLTRDYVHPVFRVGNGLAEPMRAPLQKWHARRLKDPAAYAMRLFMFHDPVTPAEASSALGAEEMERFIRAGIISATANGGLVSPLFLHIVNDLYIVSDDLAHGGEAVMGAGQTTAVLCQAAYPSEGIQASLDLGCGAGTVALMLASCARLSTGTDINPRALTFSAINAAINGIANVEWGLGDLFVPVEGERFDLVVSQPPFVARRAGAPPATYLYGGTRGDELPLRLLGDLPGYLAEDGRAVLLVEWPIVDGQPLEQRIRAALRSEDVNLLLLQFPPIDLDEYCSHLAGVGTVGCGDEFETRAILTRDHLDKTGISGLRQTLVIVQRSQSARCWTSTIDIRAGGAPLLTSDRIDMLVASRDLLTRSDEALLGSCLVMPEGSVLGSECAVSNRDQTTLRIRFPKSSMVHDADMNPEAVLLVSLVHDAPSVGAAVDAFAHRTSKMGEGTTETILQAVREALLMGLLEPLP